MSNHIDALLTERAGYINRNKPERVKAVDAQLRELGYDHKYLTSDVETASIKPSVERATRAKATRRKTD